VGSPPLIPESSTGKYSNARAAPRHDRLEFKRALYRASVWSLAWKCCTRVRFAKWHFDKCYYLFCLLACLRRTLYICTAEGISKTEIEKQSDVEWLCTAASILKEAMRSNQSISNNLTFPHRQWHNTSSWGSENQCALSQSRVNFCWEKWFLTDDDIFELLFYGNNFQVLFR
jgi:hypothetical protein